MEMVFHNCLSWDADDNPSGGAVLKEVRK